MARSEFGYNTWHDHNLVTIHDRLCLLQGDATPTTKPAIKKLRGASKGGVPAEVLAAYEDGLKDLGADSWLSANTPQRKALIEDLLDAAKPASPSAGAAP